MHLSLTTMFLVPALLLATIILAQTPSPTSTSPPLNYSTACSRCIVDSAIALSPTCTIQSFTIFPSPPDTLTDTQKSCYCPLSSSNTWIEHCVKPELCNAVSINAIFRSVAALQSYACPTPPIVNTGTTTRPESSSDAAPTASAFYPYQPNPYPPGLKPTIEIPLPSEPTNSGLAIVSDFMSRMALLMIGIAALGIYL